jgi:hypothetical protein
MTTLSRVDVTDGEPHTVLYDGPRRAGSIRPNPSPSAWHVVVCACLAWARDAATQDIGVAMLARHRAVKHPEVKA